MPTYVTQEPTYGKSGRRRRSSQSHSTNGSFRQVRSSVDQSATTAPQSRITYHQPVSHHTTTTVHDPVTVHPSKQTTVMVNESQGGRAHLETHTDYVYTKATGAKHSTEKRRRKKRSSHRKGSLPNAVVIASPYRDDHMVTNELSRGHYRTHEEVHAGPMTTTTIIPNALPVPIIPSNPLQRSPLSPDFYAQRTAQFTPHLTHHSSHYASVHHPVNNTDLSSPVPVSVSSPARHPAVHQVHQEALSDSSARRLPSPSSSPLQKEKKRCFCLKPKNTSSPGKTKTSRKCCGRSKVIEASPVAHDATHLSPTRGDPSYKSSTQVPSKKLRRSISISEDVHVIETPTSSSSKIEQKAKAGCCGCGDVSSSSSFSSDGFEHDHHSPIHSSPHPHKETIVTSKKKRFHCGGICGFCSPKKKASSPRSPTSPNKKQKKRCGCCCCCKDKETQYSSSSSSSSSTVPFRPPKGSAVEKSMTQNRVHEPRSHIPNWNDTSPYSMSSPLLSSPLSSGPRSSPSASPMK